MQYRGSSSGGGRVWGRVQRQKKIHVSIQEGVERIMEKEVMLLWEEKTTMRCVGRKWWGRGIRGGEGWNVLGIGAEIGRWKRKSCSLES